MKISMKKNKKLQNKEAEVILIGFGLLLLCALLYQSPWKGLKEDSQGNGKEAALDEENIGNETADQGNETVLTASKGSQNDNPVVVIDAGHGGRDGGKLSVDGVTYEKDINLQIAYKLKAYLEAENITVIMTREGDDGLYTENDNNKKAADLKRRIEIIDKAVPDLVISVHQNSYHESSVKGAQTFYYTDSENGQRLAQIIQDQLRISLDPDNNRQAKANDSYYLLKKTAATIVIVECGFLSNPDEAALLKTEEYQDRVAWNIHLAVMQYLNQQQNS